MLMDSVNEQLVLGSGRPHRHPMKRAISVHESVYGLNAIAVSAVKNLLATADEINEVSAEEGCLLSMKISETVPL